MTPQALINLVGYGAANRRVKAMGMWRETMTDTERIQWIEETGSTIVYSQSSEEFNVFTGYGEYIDILRPAIDEASTLNTARDYRAYLEE